MHSNKKNDNFARKKFEWLMFDLRITENSSELFAIEMKGELNATEAGDEQQGAAPFGATGLPAVAEEGFALEVAVELVGELHTQVVQYLGDEIHFF